MTASARFKKSADLFNPVPGLGSVEKEDIPSEPKIAVFNP